MAFTLLSLTDFALSPITGTPYLNKSASESGSKKSNQKLIVEGFSITSVFQPSLAIAFVLSGSVDVQASIQRPSTSAEILYTTPVEVLN